LLVFPVPLFANRARNLGFGAPNPVPMPSGSDDMVRYRRCLERAGKYFGDMKLAGAWLNRAQEQLRGRSPIAALTVGDYEAVESVLVDLEAQPAPAKDVSTRKRGTLRSVRSVTGHG